MLYGATCIVGSNPTVSDLNPPKGGFFIGYFLANYNITILDIASADQKICLILYLFKKVEIAYAFSTQQYFESNLLCVCYYAISALVLIELSVELLCGR